ncbi:MAG TPA: transglutaminase family protein [Acidimicrobiales bacterium]|nr:transglutaminase family protein [Acidimicrobiales bacterium]
MRFDINYRTTFSYDDLVRESQNELRACPAADELQQLVSYRVSTVPPARVLSFTDYWGTRVDAFGVRVPHLFLEVTAEASVETRPRPLLVSTAPAESLVEESFVDAHAEYLAPSAHADWGRGVEDLAARAVVVAGDDVTSQVLAVHRAASAALTYEAGATYVGVDVEDVLAGRAGVCQDYAHLAIAMCRSRGIPARYVSGYMFTVSDATGEDAAGDVVTVQTHAWFEAAVPGVGWIALDPTNRQQVAERHVKIGHGRDYDDVLPLRGVFSGATDASVSAVVEIRRATPGTRPAVAGRGGRSRSTGGDPPLSMSDDGSQQQQ